MKPLKYIIIVFALGWTTVALAGEPLGFVWQESKYTHILRF